MKLLPFYKIFSLSLLLCFSLLVSSFITSSRSTPWKFTAFHLKRIIIAKVGFIFARLSLIGFAFFNERAQTWARRRTVISINIHKAEKMKYARATIWTCSLNKKRIVARYNCNCLLCRNFTRIDFKCIPRNLFKELLLEINGNGWVRKPDSRAEFKDRSKVVYTCVPMVLVKSQ